MLRRPSPFPREGERSAPAAPLPVSRRCRAYVRDDDDGCATGTWPGTRTVTRTLYEAPIDDEGFDRPEQSVIFTGGTSDSWERPARPRTTERRIPRTVIRVRRGPRLPRRVLHRRGVGRSERGRSLRSRGRLATGHGDRPRHRRPSVPLPDGLPPLRRSAVTPPGRRRIVGCAASSRVECTSGPRSGVAVRRRLRRRRLDAVDPDEPVTALRAAPLRLPAEFEPRARRAVVRAGLPAGRTRMVEFERHTLPSSRRGVERVDGRRVPDAAIPGVRPLPRGSAPRPRIAPRRDPGRRSPPHPSSRRSTVPRSVTVAVAPGGTTAVELASSTMAGPANSSPGDRPARS